ncbi:MAG: glycosyl transferase family 36 [Bacilli bacterium]|nr:glycosyl transferase family 36 [Bacilli bacterium]
MKFANRYGHFSDDGKEFVVTDPFTPRPWVNVISNGDYSIVVSQAGGGFSFRDNAEQNRLTRLYQDIVKDDWGKYFYIRDKESKKYFSTALKPIMTGYDRYEVRVGIGYTKFIRVQDGLEVTTTQFVSPDKPLEYIRIRIENKKPRARRLDVTSYFEWAPGIAYDNHREFHRLFTTVDIDEARKAMLVTKCLYGFPDSKGRYNNDDWPYTGFLASSEPIASFDGDKATFIGMYRDEKDAKAMEQESLANSKGRFLDPCGALRVDVDLGPNESREIVFVIGMAKKEEEDLGSFLSRASSACAEEDFEKLKVFWENLLGKDVVETDDKRFDFFTNTWSKYQAISCRLWAKAAYYQISGGIGFRDQLQDSLVFLQSNPELTKKQIMLHAEHQFFHGDVYHWWLTIHSWGPRGNCSDDFLWLAFATIEYIDETGDFSILKEKSRYVDDATMDPLYIHIKKAIYRSIELTSPRGVPLMGDHDWNDGLSAVGHGLKGESFWVSEFLYYILKKMDKILDYEKDEEFRKVVREKAELTKKTLNEFGWDGSYFLQAINDEGEKIGSSSCEEGKVFLNPQIWAVISDITTEDRKKSAMEAVDQYLFRDYGTLLLYPAYSHPCTEIGYITRYAPGLRENGGVYTHAATWSTWAYALMGENEKAYEAYIRINPIARGEKDIDVFQSEPYVTPGNSDGPISPYYGKGSWSWYSGSAQWMHHVAVSHILGVEGKASGVEIHPCLPAHMKGYRYERVFGKAKLKIVVERGDKEELRVNGDLVKGRFVEIDGSEKTYEIHLKMVK